MNEKKKNTIFFPFVAILQLGPPCVNGIRTANQNAHALWWAAVLDSPRRHEALHAPQGQEQDSTQETLVSVHVYVLPSRLPTYGQYRRPQNQRGRQAEEETENV